MPRRILRSVVLMGFIVPQLPRTNRAGLSAPLRLPRKSRAARRSLITLAQVSNATRTDPDPVTATAADGQVIVVQRDDAAAPRARLSLLWPYLRPHRRVLLLVTAISIVGALLSVAQPAMVGLVIGSVQQSLPLTGIVIGLVALVLITAVINGIQQYLLQRTAEGVVLDTAGCWLAGCCGCRSRNSTPGARVTWCPGSVRTPRCCGRW